MKQSQSEIEARTFSAPAGQTRECLAENRPARIALTLEMPGNTAVRKLDWLIRKGYITRRGTKYCMTDKVNLSGLEQVMRMQARLCETSVKKLSILDTRS